MNLKMLLQKAEHDLKGGPGLKGADMNIRAVVVLPDHHWNNAANAGKIPAYFKTAHGDMLLIDGNDTIADMIHPISELIRPVDAQKREGAGT